MPRLMSFEKTWRQLTEGVVVDLDAWTDLYGSDDPFRDAPIALDAIGWRWKWEDEMKGYVRIFKDVTRRSSHVIVDESPFGRKRREWRPGWAMLKPGDVVEGIEWSPRTGGKGGVRWACSLCGALLQSEVLTSFHRPGHAGEPDGLCPGEVLKRRPRRGVFREVVSVREERLGDIDEVEVAREGFSGKSPAWFIDFYCGGKPDPDRPVNRIEFKEVEA